MPPDGAYEQSPQDRAITTLFHPAKEESLVAVLEVALSCPNGADALQVVHGVAGQGLADRSLTQLP